jgi:flagellar biosynthetic protein FliO
MFQANAAGHGDSTQIYTQPKPVVLTAAADTPQRALAAKQGELSFPTLKPRSPDQDPGRDVAELGERSGKLAAPTITVISSLAVVLGLFAALVWGSRRFGNGTTRNASIPKEVIQTLGSVPIDPRTRVTMLRCGNRVLLLAQTAGTVQTLCEITDPQEVHDLTAACLGKSKREFASTLRSIENETTSGGFVEQAINPNAAATRRRLFASA